MKKSIRFALLAGAVFASLAFASSAFASFAPKLVVSSATPATAGGTVRVGVVVSNNDDPTASVQIYVPAAYKLGAPAAGTKLGDLTATASIADLGGAVVPLSGELQAIAPTATTTAAAAQCGVAPAQTWNLHLTLAGQVLDVPMFVVTASAPEVAAGYQAKLVVCLPPPDIPAGTPGRATNGAKLLSATFTSSAVTEPTTSGDYRWTSLWTPYNAGRGTVNRAGTVEVQSIRHLPLLVKPTVTKKKVTKFKRVNGKRRTIVTTAVRVSTTVRENGAAPSSLTVTTTAGGKRIGADSGAFVLAAGKSAKVTVKAVIDSDSGFVPSAASGSTPADLFFHDLGTAGCVKTAIFGGLPCNDATVGGETVTVSVTVKGYR
ncbi:MAG: hypothetical protein ACJ76I_05835 [Gaiellaceae bacterium]